MGAGNWPAGSVIAGGDVYVRSPAVPPRQASAKFDTITHDAVVLSDGSIAVVHFVDQQVALALGVELGTIPSAPTIGIRLAGIRLSTKATFQRAVEDAVRGAVGFLLATKSIRIDSIVGKWTPNRKPWTVNYTNLVIPSARSRPVAGVA